MRGFAAVLRRELAALFLSPFAWVLLLLALLVEGVLFLTALRSWTGGELNESVRLVLGGTFWFWFLQMFMAPLLTMRAISEEARSGTLELILTAPVRDGAVILGKAAAATVFLALVWLAVPVYGLAAALLGTAPDWGLVLTAWTGAVLVSALFSSIGLAASALSRTPIVAAFLGFVAIAALVFGPYFALRGGGAEGIAGWLAARAGILRAVSHSFVNGALDSGHVVLLVAWTGVFLFLATRLLETRRWAV